MPCARRSANRRGLPYCCSSAGGNAARTSCVRPTAPEIFEDAENGLSSRVISLLHRLRRRSLALDVEIEEATRELTVWAEQSALCRRAATVPGIGPSIATAVVAFVGDGHMFAAGRNMAAWLGLVPRQYTTGGTPSLGGISKRGNTCLRQLFVQGVEALYVHTKRDQSHLGAWLHQVEGRAHRNVAVVALANRRATRAPEDDRLARDEAYFNLGLVFRAQRRYPEALACFDRAIALDPKYTAALEAQADVRSALTVEVPEDHAQHWRQMLHAMRRNPARCHELVRAYTRRFPERFGGWVVFVDVFAGFARYDEAMSALRKAQRLSKSENWKESPDAPFAVQWGLLYQQKKDYVRAERSFRRAVVLRPSASNLTRLAVQLVIQGEFATARRHLQRAIRISSDDSSPAYYQLGLITRARRPYADALKHFETAHRLSPQDPLAHLACRDVREAMKVFGSRRSTALEAFGRRHDQQGEE
jgi:tetratricopeptide (TPR) repeat protein